MDTTDNSEILDNNPICEFVKDVWAQVSEKIAQTLPRTVVVDMLIYLVLFVFASVAVIILRAC